MRCKLRPLRCRRERGAVAVEAAIVLPVLVLIIAAPTIALAHFCLQWDATYKAVQDAALAVATAPRIELTTAGPDGSFAAISIAQPSPCVSPIVAFPKPAEPLLKSMVRPVLSRKASHAEPVRLATVARG